jgi:hypothetical protein
MTVGELIQMLMEFDSETPVQVNVNRAGKVFDIEQVDAFDGNEEYGDSECVMLQVDI